MEIVHACLYACGSMLTIVIELNCSVNYAFYKLIFSSSEEKRQLMLPVAIIVYLSHAVAIVPILHPIGPAEIVWNKTKDACPRAFTFI